MTASEVKLYPYRWVVLAAFMLVNVMVQVLWICYAPVASIAATAYGVKRADVDLLANLFMLIYIPIAFPAAWAIDTFGFKKAVGFGAMLMAGITPVAYQYGAEITYPAPEGTSNGIFALMVQASGLLIVLMDVLRGTFHDSYIPSFIGLASLLALSGILLFSLKESPRMQGEVKAAAQGK
jgi:hypothetical protein